MIMRLKPLPLLLAAIVACTSTQPTTCPPQEHPVVLESLYFGTARPDGVVTAQEWESFLRDTVTPHFPEGLTSWTASGQWTTSTGALRQEASYILQLGHDATQEKDQAVHHLIETYKRRFRQDAVMRIRSYACRSF